MLVDEKSYIEGVELGPGHCASYVHSGGHPGFWLCYHYGVEVPGWSTDEILEWLAQGLELPVPAGEDDWGWVSWDWMTCDECTLCNGPT